MDRLLNNSSDTIVTQAGGHDGSDDQRSVRVGSYTLILPTLAELAALRADQSNTTPAGWFEFNYHAADRADANRHSRVLLTAETVEEIADNTSAAIAFQVIVSDDAVLAAPTAITATPAAGSLAVSWMPTPQSNNGGAPITGYVASASAASQGTRTCTAAANATTCTIANLTGGVEYSVIVSVSNEAGRMASSAAVLATPEAPGPVAVLDLGTDTASGINLRLIAPATVNSKLYYIIDNDENGFVTNGDRIDHNTLDTLFNDGTNTTGTQEGSHDGTNDARSVIVGNYALVLPTSTELQALITSQSVPSGWFPTAHWGADGQGNNHRSVSPGSVTLTTDVTVLHTAVQVITRGTVTAPAAPVFNVTPSNESVVVNWTSVPDSDNGGAPITAYVASATKTGETVPEACTTDAAAVTCTIMGLDAGVEYSVVVEAINRVGSTLPTAQTATPLAITVPARPTGIALTPGNGGLGVAWDSVTNDGGTPITQYTATATADGETTGACGRRSFGNSSPGTLCTITGLTNGVTYFVTVFATNSIGDGPLAGDARNRPIPIIIGVPGPPTGVTAEPGNGQVTVAWVAPATDNGAPITGYQVRPIRAMTPTSMRAFLDDSFFCNTDAATTTCVITGLSNGIEHSFGVRAMNSRGFSVNVNRATATPMAPAGDALMLGDDYSGSGINLNLRFPVTTADGKLYYYLDHNSGSANTADQHNHNVLDALLNGGDDTVDTQPSGHDGSDDARSVIVDGYTLILPTAAEMQALHTDQTSRPSNWLNDAYHTATLQGSGNVHSSYNWGTIGDIRVAADSGERSTVFQVIDKGGVPTAEPADVTVTSAEGELVVAWSEVPDTSNGGAAITGYTASAINLDGSIADTCDDDATPFTCTLDGVENGTTYNVGVVAKNRVGNGPRSKSIMRIPGTPATPASVMLTAGNGEIVVAWTAVPEDGNGGDLITGYKLQSFIAAFGQTQVAQDEVICLGATTATCTLTGLSNGVRYRVVVRTTNSRGDSPASPDMFAMPVDAPDSTHSLELGTVEGIKLNLLYPYTATDGKVYYYLDHDEDGNDSLGDVVSHDQLDMLLNEGNDTVDTQTSGHNGADDARSVRVGSYTLVLPTLAEMGILRAESSDHISGKNTPSTSWRNTSTNTSYHTASRDAGTGNTGERHYAFQFRNDAAPSQNDPSTRYAVFQVIDRSSVPVAPADVSVTSADGELVVEWSAVPDAINGAVITGYTATATNPDDSTDTDTCDSADAATVTCTLDEVDNGTTYEVTVFATNRIGNGPPSPAIAIIPGSPAAAPTDLTLRPDNRQIMVTWTAVAAAAAADNNGAAIDGYQAEVFLADGTLQENLGCTADGAAATTCTITGLTNGTQYSITVRARNSRGGGVRSASKTTTPLLAPSDTLSLGTVSGINLNLRYPVTTAKGKVYYYLAHSDSPIADPTDTVNHDQLDDLLNGGNRIIDTQTDGHDGTNDARSVIIKTYTLILPTLVELQALYNESDQLPSNWRTGSPDYLTSSPSGNDRHFVLNAATGVSTISVADDASVYITFQVINTPIVSAAPTEVTAIPTTDGTLRIAWTAVPDADSGGSPVLTYTATATASGETDQTCTADAPAVTCDISGLTNSTTYDIAVVATNDAGDSPDSASASAVVGHPAVVNGIMLTPGHEQIIVTWEPVPDTSSGGSSVLTYTATATNSGDDSDTAMCTADAPASGAATASCVITGLDNGTEYGVVVLAANSRGDSAPSAPISATPVAASVVTLALTQALISESGTITRSTITATLDKAAGVDIIVEVTAAPTTAATAADYTLSVPAMLTFTAGATESSGEVTIDAVDNNVMDAAAKIITLSATANPDYAAVNPADVVLTIVDGDGISLDAPEAQLVSEGFALKPSGVDAGGSFRLLYVTTDTTAATFTDIATYNTHVQTSAAGTETEGHAAIKPFSGEFRALISTAAVDARDNTATNRATAIDTDAPIYWLNGAKVADDYADFYDGNWDSVAGTDRDGGTYSFADPDANNQVIWTGSNDDGTQHSINFAGTSLSNRVRLGRFLESNEIDNDRLPGERTYPLYTLSPVLTLNQAPTVATAISYQRTASGAAFTYTFPIGTFADADRDALTYSFEVSPAAAWLSFNAATRTFSGMPTTAGMFTITVTAADGTDEITNEFTLTVVPANPPQAQTIPAAFTFKPTAVDAGGSFRLLYVTTATTQATFTDIAAYNTHVQTSAGGGAAAIQAFKDEFRALISTETVDARDNTATNSATSSDTDVPIYWLNGDKVADDYDNFYDGGWDSAAGTDRDGGTYSFTDALEAAQIIWTGSNADGTQHSTHFPGSSSTRVRYGLLSSTSEIDHNRESETFSRPLYALSPVLTLEHAPIVDAANAIPDQRAFSGAAFTHTFAEDTFTDADSDTLNYSFEVSPAADWLTFDAANRTFTGTPPAAGLPDNRMFTITVTASDGRNSAADEFVLTIVPVSLTLPEAQTVPAAFALKPDAIAAGGSFRLLYVTTATTQATFTDIAPYNTHVQTSAGGGAAAIQAFSSEFRALISTAAVDARDNTATNRVTATDTDAPIYWLNGAKVADNYGGFYDGGWDSAVGTDRDGGTYSFTETNTGLHVIWTGSLNSGIKQADDFDDFAGTLTPSVGRLSESSEISDSLLISTGQLPLYALSPILTLEHAPIVATAITDQRTFVGDTSFTYTFADDTFTDADSDTLNYSFEVTPTAAWLSFDATTRTFTGTPAEGVFTITVTASDGRNSVTDEFVLTIASVILTLPEAQTIPADFTFKPTAIADGGSFRLLYVTTETIAATFTDIATYNTHVQTSAGVGAAAIRDFKDEFRALISTETVDARDNTATNRVTASDADVPIYWLNGDKVADDYTDFYDGNWDSVAGTDQSGNTYSFAGNTGGDLIWTGSASDGTERMGGAAGEGSLVAFGELKTGQELVSQLAGGIGKTFLQPLYALSPILTLNQAPTVANVIPDQRTFPGNLFDYTFPANTFADADSDTLTYTVEVSPAAAWLAFNPTSRNFTGTPTASELPADGMFTITITASDGRNSVTDDFTLNAAPTDTAPQTVLRLGTFSLGTASFGTTSEINLTLIFPVTVGDKVYYFLDRNDDLAIGGDSITHHVLDELLNDGVDTIDTQPGGHDGSDDARSVIVGDYALVLPTVAEMEALYTQYEGNENNNTPPKWQTSADNFYRTSNRTESDRHSVFRFRDGVSRPTSDDALLPVAFQVIVAAPSAPAVANPIPDQRAFAGTDFDYAFPANTFADPNGDTLTYSFTVEPAAAWLSFDADTRAFSGTLPADGEFTITVTASDGTNSVTDEFILNAAPSNTPPRSMLQLGRMSGINLNLILPVTVNDDTADTADDKVYYYLDGNGDGVADADDVHNQLDRLLNNGDDTIDTQTGGHNGSEDERSVRVGGYSLVLPTVEEMEALYADQQPNAAPTGWYDGAQVFYRSASRTGGVGSDSHEVFSFGLGTRSAIADTTALFVAFEVIVASADSPTVDKLIPDQRAFAGDASFAYAFPADTFADPNGDALTYSFTVEPAAAWLSFDADNRAFSGTPPASQPPADEVFTITVTASDGTNEVADEFTLTVATSSIMLSATSVTLAEGSTTATYTAVLDVVPLDTVTVTITSSNDDVTATPSVLTFTTSDYDTAQEVIIRAVADADAVKDSAILTHTASSGYGGVTADLSVTVTDNDTAGLTLNPTAVGMIEGGKDTYTAVLDTQPTAPVTVVILSDNVDVTTALGATAPATQTTLTFTESDWNVAQTVTINAAEDADAMDDDATLTHTANGGGYVNVVETVAVTVADNEAPNLILTPTVVTLDEGGTAVYTVALTIAPTAEVTVDITGTGVTLDPGTLTFTASDWSTAQTVTITAAEDGDVGNALVTLKHTASGVGSGYVDVTGTVNVTVIDNDAGLTLSATTVTLDEGSNTFTYTVALAAQPNADVMVRIGSDNGDVTLDKTSLLFTMTNWGTAQTVTIIAKENDDAVTDSAMLKHTASGVGSGYENVTGTVGVTVIDNDAGLVLTPTAVTLDEGSNTFTYTVALAAEPNEDVMVRIGSDNGDVTLDKTSLTFTTVNWETAQTITITAAENDDVGNASATLTHTANSVDSGYVGVTGTVGVTVIDNDAGLTLSATTVTLDEGSNTFIYTVALAAEPKAPVTVKITSDNNDVTLDETSLTFTTVNWEIAQTVTITADEDDDAANDSDTLTHTASGDGSGYETVTGTVVVTVTDNDAGLVLPPTAVILDEGSNTFTYTVALTAPPKAEVTVAIASDNDDVTPDKTSLTFTTSNWNTAQTITITAKEDDDAATDSAMLTHTASGDGSGYENVTGTVGVTVTDNDTVGLVLTPTAITLDEGSNTFTYTVALAAQPSADVMVDIVITKGNGDVTLNNTSLAFTISDWNTPQDVTITATENGGVGNASVTLTHTANGVGSGYVGVTGTVGVTVIDNDAGLTLSATTVTLDEGSNTFIYTVALAAQPSADVMVDIVSDNSDVTLDKTSLAFTMTNWEIAQTVTITAKEDDDVVNDSDTLTHTASGDGSGYETVTGTVDVTITDNDTPPTNRLNEQILTRASQAITTGTLAAVGARVDAAIGFGIGGNVGAGVSANAAAPTLAYQLGGQSSLHGLLQANGKAMLEDEMDYERLLDGASFVMSLSADGDQSTGTSGGLSLWGGSELLNLDGDADNIDWDGEVVSFHLGVDKPLGNNMLAGVALSLNTASFDYTDNNDGLSGDYEYTTTNLHPYFGYVHSEKLNLWGTAGFGNGEIGISVGNAAKNDTGTSLLSLAGGFSTRLLGLSGATTLNIKGDFSQATVDVDANAAGGIAAQTIASNRIRLLLAGKSRRESAGGGTMTPSLETGIRVDGGDGETGSGIELNAGIHYASPNGLSVQGGVHTLLGHDGYNETGADFTVRLTPKSGRGLSLSLQPVWGETQSTTERLWDDGINELSGDDTALRSRMNSEVGYGLAATMLGAVGVLTPYTGMTTVDGEVSHVRLGGRFAGGDGLSLNLEGAQENGADSASHTVLLRGELAF